MPQTPTVIYPVQDEGKARDSRGRECYMKWMLQIK